MQRLALLAFALAFTPEAPAVEPDRRPMQVEDLFQFKRVADPQISPDGTQVVYQVTTVDLDGNKSTAALWLAAADGSTPPRQLTNPNGKKDAHPRWSPDGKHLLFESTRTGTPQLFKLALAGGEAAQLTTISTGAGSALWSPDGQSIVFASTVYPEFSELPFAEADAKNKAKTDAAEANPVKAKVFTKLFFRHWDSYVEDKRQHLFVCDADGKNVRNVTPGDRDAVPTSSTFSAGDDFTFTPDSEHLVFTATPEVGEAWTTDYNLCRVGITNTSTKWETLTGANKAADNGPRFSPDGKKLAYRSQRKPGYEADKWELTLVAVNPDGTFVGAPKSLTAEVDASYDDFAWGGGGRIVAITEEKGLKLARGVAWDGQAPAPALPEYLAPLGVLALSAPKAGPMTALTAQMNRPAEVFVAGRNISHANDLLLAQLSLGRPETVQVKVEGGEMQMWILKPPNFNPGKKWPVVYLVHGGPQGAWEDGWSYRWNPQLWAAQGYVVALPNPRGSTGFGQKFVDEISGDWGGKCYRDLEAGLDLIEKLPYVDKDRIGSAGASFGGYMQDWFAVNPIAKRLKCLISHCSVWNFESMWGTTEELWFDEYEHGGLPWEVPGKYAEFSPHKKANKLAEYKVPMLVIQNDLDFRCPIGQGHELFTALQRQGVPSRMVNFPDEGHWVLKPKNSQLWHKEVFAWLTKYVPPGAK